MAENIQLNVTVRESSGKGGARKTRAKGLTPGVIYGRDKENIVVAFDSFALKKALVKGGGINTLLNLVEDKTKTFGKKTVIVKDIQKDPITSHTLHADFYELDLTQTVTVEVPLQFVGKAEGLKKGGIVQPVIREVKVKALPSNIPSRIEVDVSALDVGDSLHLEDLKATGDYEITFEHNETVVTVAIPKEEEVKAPEPVEGAVAAEGAAAEGAKPAEGAAVKEGEKPAEAKKEPEKK